MSYVNFIYSFLNIEAHNVPFFGEGWGMFCDIFNELDF